MKNWKTVKLGEVVEPIETTDPTKAAQNEFTYIDVSSISRASFEIESTSVLLGKDAPSRARRAVKEGDVLFATIRPTLQRIAIVPQELDGAVCSTGYYVLRAKSELVSPSYIFHYLFSEAFFAEMEQLQRGASYPAVSDNDVKQHYIPLPPLEEQKRIVAILDTAFAAIATATANTQKVHDKAKEVFERARRDFIQAGGNGWIETTIGQQLVLQRGFDITKSQQESGKIPVVSSGGIKSYHSTFKASGPGVILGRKGSIGSIYYIEEDYWPHDTTLWVKDYKDNLPKYIFHFMHTLDLRGLDSGTANPALNRNLIHPIKVLWPTIFQQHRIVEKLDALAEQTERVAALAERKLALLDALKQSLLAKAFRGELTTEDAQPGNAALLSCSQAIA